MHGCKFKKSSVPIMPLLFTQKIPLSGNTAEIYREVNCYPSKPIGLYTKQSVIFRTDSNAKVLEGYAGAGLHDSVIMDKEEKIVWDYSSDRMIFDRGFQVSLFSRIADVGKILEGLYGCPQDIEGVVKDGLIYIVQSRPQTTAVVDKEENIVLDYLSGRMIIDGAFQVSLLSRIAQGICGCSKDIECVVKDGLIYVVQSRPQI
ncbi:alpha-glucan water dikinase, chloroplastic-like [Rosa rugosa]|uniref:alpha-glucan water dikinase, chloroplastic-like n=1 Tax=Rosa rugosa TaxID=74645 RepID=UPI002B405F27|nr:alpha-glucan water dikinase, chloroplastic-like [Rosa rugosa]